MDRDAKITAILLIAMALIIGFLSAALAINAWGGELEDKEHELVLVLKDVEIVRLRRALHNEKFRMLQIELKALQMKELRLKQEILELKEVRPNEESISPDS